LNRDQIDTFNPPPNFVKLRDSRAPEYIAEFGHDSWELDALDPATLSGLIEDAVAELRDDNQWQEDVDLQEKMRKNLLAVRENWPEVKTFLELDDEEE